MAVKKKIVDLLYDKNVLIFYFKNIYRFGIIIMYEKKCGKVCFKILNICIWKKINI